MQMSKNKTKAVMEELKEDARNDSIDMLIADMLSLAEVKHMADEFKKKYDHLDVLVNNPGAQFRKDGKQLLEREWGVKNHYNAQSIC